MTKDLYELFPSVSWRGIPFPVESLENEIVHAHAEHYFPYRDGCHIEATGRNALIFGARIPFHNGVLAGPGEAWAGQVLFPDLFIKFRNAVLDRTTGVLAHPDFGPINCKARSATWTYQSSQGRDGATINVKWYETVNTGDDLNIASTNQSPIAAAIAAADSLDQSLEVASPKTGPMPELANDKKSFGTMMRDYNDGTGNLSAVKKKNDNLAAALDRRNDVNDWPLRSASEDLRAATFTLSSNPNVGNRQVVGHTTENPTTIPLLALKLGTTTTSLITLNPGLATQSRVDPGTKVLYQISL